jgi:hypothetical protein
VLATLCASRLMFPLKMISTWGVRRRCHCVGGSDWLNNCVLVTITNRTLIRCTKVIFFIVREICSTALASSFGCELVQNNSQHGKDNIRHPHSEEEVRAFGLGNSFGEQEKGNVYEGKNESRCKL